MFSSEFSGKPFTISINIVKFVKSQIFGIIFLLTAKGNEMQKAKENSLTQNIGFVNFRQ
jgi:hypothetical protein